MPSPRNRVFEDLQKLRSEKKRLIESRLYRVSRHAGEKHPELTDEERVAVVLLGTGDRLDRNREPTDGVYVCWASLPVHGLCRGVYCVVQSDRSYLKIITAFPED